MKRSLILIPLLTILVLGGCSKTQVSRVDSDTTIDLSGHWNDTDSRLVSEAMIGDCLAAPWINKHRMASTEAPVVIAGSIRNRTNEHIEREIFLLDLERAFINSGDVDVVASAEEREELRAERLDQLVNASPETVKQMGREAGADYMLIGSIKAQPDQADGIEVMFYQTDLQLIHIESNKKVWIGSHEIKKVRQQGKYKG
jgi:uncharacterized protein (TIGR02722 family)